MKILFMFFTLALSVLLCSCNTGNSQRDDSGDQNDVRIDTIQGTSLLGEKLTSEQPDPQEDSLVIANYIEARKEYNENPDDADAIIWFGRRTAYLGDYLRAIEIFSEGTQKFPDDARMYRHRGHRYISVREFDKAIDDLSKAAELIEGKDDIVEPDGVPNIRNTPVSTLNTNIWYHLGLAHYLKGNMQEALHGFQQSLDASTNPDMHVAAANWVYMIQRRLGHLEEAEEILEPINSDMDVFENMAYHNLLLFYKGVLTEEELKGDNQDVEYMNDATAYGIGNWYYYKGDTTRAKQIFQDLLEHGTWASFGTLAAEADMDRMVE
ncbi:MAG: tetratricopeptide repeat protein [Bacteroidota bacterium]